MRTSHTYELSRRVLLLALGVPLIPVAAFALLMQCGAATRLLPKPCPTLDIDRTILLHQAQATLQPQSADLLLLGDSSCLMDVRADELGTREHRPGAALNLGTLSYLDLDAFTEILQHYLASNPGHPQTLVLLMHPEALRRLSPADYDLNVLEHFYSGTDFCGPDVSAPFCWIGVEIFRGRLLSRVVPQPLPGSFGQAYGFTRDLWRFLSTHQGSAVDPGTYDPAHAPGNPEYRLSRRLQDASARLRAVLQRGVRMAVGITPVPEGYAAPRYAALRDQMLRTWSHWLQADLVLSNLPPTMPDRLFASRTHLNRTGARLFTEQLSGALSPPNAPTNRSTIPQP